MNFLRILKSRLLIRNVTSLVGAAVGVAASPLLIINPALFGLIMLIYGFSIFALNWVDHRSLGFEKTNLYKDSNLLRAAFSELVDVMRDRLRDMGRYNDAIESIMNDKKIPPKQKLSKITRLTSQSEYNEEKLKVPLIKSATDKLCAVFKQDTYIPEEVTRPPYFKATFYEVVKQNHGEEVLKRLIYSYPPQMDPSPESEIIPKQGKYSRVTANLCWKWGKRVIIEDAHEEMKEPSDQTRWVPLYTGQEKDYQSMVSEPVYRGQRKQPTWKFRGVLTIDTNRRRYFEETNESNNFLAELIHPYGIFIALLYEIEKRQKLFLQCIKPTHKTN